MKELHGFAFVKEVDVSEINRQSDFVPPHQDRGRINVCG